MGSAKNIASRNVDTRMLIFLTEHFVNSIFAGPFLWSSGVNKNG